DLERQLCRRVERLAVRQIEPRQVERAGPRPGGQEALVQLEILVAADPLRRGELATLVDDEDLVGAVDDDHLHLAVLDLVDADQVDPPHRSAAPPPRPSPPIVEPRRRGDCCGGVTRRPPPPPPPPASPR